MRKITCFKVAFLFLFIFSLLEFPVLAKGQSFPGQQESLNPQMEQEPAKVWDPLEKSNRKVFKFNDWFYTDIVRPVSRVYLKVPQPVRNAVGNTFDNLEDPARFVNFVLQGRPRRAGNEMARFILNSTVGIGGFFDVAQNACGIQGNNADFGQTLGIWGLGPGAYLLIPVLGPSDERDFLGYVADSAMDPLFWVPGPWWVTAPPSALKYVNTASLHIGQYEAMKRACLDPYVAMRNAYMQYRQHLIEKR